MSTSASTTRWWQYVERITRGASGAEIARKVEFDQSAISRWKNGERPRWDFVLKFARAYGRNVLEALAEAEYITDAEANVHEVKVEIEDLSMEQLAEEMLRRVRAAR
jgi:transcriptional regulator with XRE-family HTH domain